MTTWTRWAALFVASSLACDPSPNDDARVRRGCPPDGATARTEEIRAGLESACANCHLTGEKGYFASLGAFQSLLVSDPRLVAPGDPDGSELVRLLEGRGGGTLFRMPLGEKSFAELDAEGATDVSMDEIRSWIEELDDDPTGSPKPDREAPTVRRISGAHVEVALRDLLGLTHEDFFQEGYEFHVVVDVPRWPADYPVHAVDSVPGSHGAAVTNYLRLGGGKAIDVVTPDSRAIDPPFTQILVPLSQRWCAMAIAKPDNTTLMGDVDPSIGSADTPAVVAHIAEMHRRMLGVAPSGEERQRIYDEVFAVLEAENESAEIGWIGVCSYLIRHPQFLLY